MATLVEWGGRTLIAMGLQGDLGKDFAAKAIEEAPCYTNHISLAKSLTMTQTNL